MKKIIIGLVIILTLLPLFRPGLFDVHDPTSVVRFFTLTQTLRAGQFPAAWTNLLNEGFGYPLFLYYAPVFGYLGALLKLLTPTYIMALKLAIGLLVLLGGFGMYRLMRQSFGALGATLGAVAYTLLPYHASTIYVRGAYAEGVTWALLPWLLYFWSQTRRDKRWIAATSVVTSLFFLSHNSLPFAFLPFLLLWIILHWPKNWFTTCAPLLLTLGLTAWFLAPVLFERGFVQAEMVATQTVYSDHFLYPWQLWNSPWGYGGSAPMGQTDGMSFMLGKFQLVLAGLSLVWLTLRKRWDRRTIFFVTMFLFYAWMTTYLASPVWSLVKSLAILQFPWRLLAFASFGVAALSGAALNFVPKKLQIIACLFLVGGLVFFNLKFFKPQSYLPYTDNNFLNPSALSAVAHDKIPEYLPATMPEFLIASQNDGLVRTPISASGQFTNPVRQLVMVQTAYMPQWQLTLDGVFTPIQASADGSIVTTDPAEAGSHQVSLIWQRTNIENWGLAISAISLLAVIGLWL